mmetsp:Transcript_76321/g.192110  ORF Transcript_76321/g.192110 Transcript_76321/m.192110 type:complete len:202 (-) Transcript_76321:42-647(-)
MQETRNPPLPALNSLLERRPAWVVSEEICLLHDPQELFLVYLTISVAVSLVDHLLELLVGHALAQFLRDALQVLEGDLACLVIVEQAKCLQDLVLGVAIQDLVGHHLQELLIADGATAVVVHVRNHLLDFFLLRLEAKGTHCHLQLLGVDLARPIGVKEVECLFDLLLLLLRQLLLLLASCIEAPESHFCTEAQSERTLAR